MSEVLSAIVAYKELVSLLLTLFVTVILMWVYWERVGFWLWNFKYGLPLIGKLSSLSDQLDRPQGATWYLAEETLCADYASWIRGGKKSAYDRAKRYLAKAGDSKSRNTPFFLWLILAALVFSEAITFASALAPIFASENSTPDQQMVIAAGFALIIGCVSLFVMHNAGEAIHRNSVISRAMKQWQTDRNKSGNLEVNIVHLDEDQSKDDHQKNYEQTLNRVGNDKHLFWVSTAAAVLLIIGSLSGMVRYNTMQNERCSKATEAVAYGQEKAVQDAAAAQAATDEAKCKSDNAIASFEGAAMMTFIFVAVQLLGIGWGMKYSFVGNDSENAYRIIGNGRFSNYEEYRSFVYKRIADTAQARLVDLRQRMQKSGTKDCVELNFCNKTFHDFFAESQDSATANPNTTTVSSAQTTRWYWATQSSGTSPTAVSAGEIKNLIAQGKLKNTDKVCKEGGQEWFKINDVAELQGQAVAGAKAGSPQGPGWTVTMEYGAKLTGIAGQYTGLTEEISAAKPLVLGRDPSRCAIVFDAATGVSGAHCQLSLDSLRGIVTLTDLGSSNGTFHRNARLPKNGQAEIANGETFYLVAEGNQFKINIFQLQGA